MSKKDYIILSEAIKHTASGKNLPCDFEAIEALKEVAYNIACRLQEQNARFDFVKFIKACGITK